MSTTSTDRTSRIGDIAIKAPVVAASTAALTLSGTQTVDGVALVTGDRVLVKDQASSIANGIYVVDTGDWSRSTDCDGSYDLANGTIVKVNSGTVGQGFWYAAGTNPIIVGTSAQTWGQASTVLAVVSAFMQTMLDDTTAAAARTTLGSTTVGDAVFIAATAAAGRTALSAAGSGLATASGLTQSTARLLGRTTAGTGAIEEITVTGASFTAGALSLAVRSYLAGCGLANGTDATNDINFSAGQCMDSTNAVLITCAAMAGKQLDVGWAPGAAAGMRNSGAAITNTTYHLYAVAKADGTQDYYAHTSTTVATVITALQAESGGSAYLYARRIGSIVRSGATILAFTQDGDTFSLTASVSDLSLSANVVAAVTKALTVPTGVRVEAFGTASLAASGVGASWFLVSDLSVADEVPSINNATCGTVASGQNAGTYRTLTDTSAQVRYRGSTTNADTIVMRTRGWVDRRGRDA